ncbi:MAG TPA: HAMP domain-containing sensor histidine kinase [Actinomycetota bacterium]|nr:HAMP domain-containing sensor histidine kinase [Actinomycetota bacterium]
MGTSDEERTTSDAKAARTLQLLVALPFLGWLAWRLPGLLPDIAEADVAFFTAVVMAVDLIPVPAWGGLQLSLSFPILLGAAIVFEPPIAAVIAFVGSIDPRELRREVTLVKAVYNRAQMATAVAAASVLFHATSTLDSPWFRLVPAVMLATIAGYAVNTLFVAAVASLDRRIAIWHVIAKMHGAAPYQFLFSYLGLGLFGAVIARFFVIEGIWSVVVFLAPLVFARQMYFRSRALADRLADQNKVLAEQARRLEQLLEKEHQNVAELRELNRMKGEFVAVVSHELRTPVTALIGYAKTLRQPEFSDDATIRDEFLERMERQGDRLLRLVENLLTASNLENNKLPVSIGRVLFEDLCREVVEGLSTEGERVRVGVPNDLPVLFTDRQLLSRVVSNLIDNALKYSPDGSPCELGASKEEDGIRFWVRDQGIGIPPQQVDRIFDRFYQVDSSTTRTFRGAGLGLSLVRDLLEHLGGTIDVDSAQGEGSTFSVWLPTKHEAPLAPENGSGGAHPRLVSTGDPAA